MYTGGRRLGKVNTPSTSSASGFWGLTDMLLARQNSTWPFTGYTIVQTFTATSTWTCPTGVIEVEYLVVAGGGGGAGQTAGQVRGAGGSGVVVIRIPDFYTATFSAGLTTSANTAAVAGYKVYSVTAGTGTVTFSLA